jgi:hypothetical protein
MNLNTAQINQKLNEFILKFKAMENDEKMALGAIVLGILLVIIYLMLI